LNRIGHALALEQPTSNTPEHTAKQNYLLLFGAFCGGFLVPFLVAIVPSSLELYEEFNKLQFLKVQTFHAQASLENTKAVLARST
jgi:hypothetical protein